MALLHFQSDDVIRTNRHQSSLLRAVAAHYDRKNKRVMIQLSSNLDVSFSPENAQGLDKATPAQLQEIQISPSGFGIHFPKLDTDLYLPALLEGFFGSKKWMAARLGHAVGKSRSLPRKPRRERTAGLAAGRGEKTGSAERSSMA